MMTLCSNRRMYVIAELREIGGSQQHKLKMLCRAAYTLVVGLAVIADILGLAGCANPSFVASGKWQVVDVTDGGSRPVSSATVLFTYRGSSSAIVDSSDSCFRARLTTTNSAGEFDWPPDGVSASATVYKRGLVYANLRAPYRSSEHLIRLKAPAGDADLISQFAWVEGVSLCANIGDHGQAIVDFLEQAQIGVQDISDVGRANAVRARLAEVRRVMTPSSRAAQ